LALTQSVERQTSNRKVTKRRFGSQPGKVIVHR